MMVQHHTQMLNELKTMATAKQATVDSTENDVTRAAIQNLSNLSGKDFDAQWTEQMLQLHENTVELFTTMLNMTTDPDLKQWLTKSLPIVTQHRDMLASKEPKHPNKQPGQG